MLGGHCADMRCGWDVRMGETSAQAYAALGQALGDTRIDVFHDGIAKVVTNFTAAAARSPWTHFPLGRVSGLRLWSGWKQEPRRMHSIRCQRLRSRPQ